MKQDQLDEHKEKKSKSQRKREMTAIQRMGEKLVDLSKTQIQQMEAPDDFKEALLFAKTMKAGEGKRRQMQYIGSLMREIEGEKLDPIQRVLENILHGNQEAAWKFQQLEKWRDELIEGKKGTMEEIMEHFPTGDRQKIRQLTSNARKEKESEKPPKSYRALFRYLKELQATG